MFTESNASGQKYEEAVDHYLFTTNRLRIIKLQSGKMVSRLNVEKEYNLANLRAFGTACFVLIPKSRREDYYTKHAEAGLIAGYAENTHAYRVYFFFFDKNESRSIDAVCYYSRRNFSMQGEKSFNKLRRMTLSKMHQNYQMEKKKMQKMWKQNQYPPSEVPLGETRAEIKQEPITEVQEPPRKSARIRVPSEAALRACHRK